MKIFRKIAGWGFPVLLFTGLCGARAEAQTPAQIAPVVVDTAVPIIVSAVKSRSKTVGLGKFEGYVMHANIAQITVRAKGNDMSLQTFPLSEQASSRMQSIVDRGGYQYGDKVTIYYDQTSLKALRVKGKPSKPI